VWVELWNTTETLKQELARTKRRRRFRAVSDMHETVIYRPSSESGSSSGLWPTLLEKCFPRDKIVHQRPAIGQHRKVYMVRSFALEVTVEVSPQVATLIWGQLNLLKVERNILQTLDLRPCESVLDLRGEIGGLRRRDNERGCEYLGSTWCHLQICSMVRYGLTIRVFPTISVQKLTFICMGGSESGSKLLWCAFEESDLRSLSA